MPLGAAVKVRPLLTLKFIIQIGIASLYMGRRIRGGHGRLVYRLGMGRDLALIIRSSEHEGDKANRVVERVDYSGRNGST